MESEVGIQPAHDALAAATPSSRSSSGRLAKQNMVKRVSASKAKEAKEFSDTLFGGFDWGKRGLVWSDPRCKPAFISTIDRVPLIRIDHLAS
jgi:hypothetical protein